MNRVLVTGISGFIGRRVAPFLLERGFEVHGVGRGHRPALLEAPVAWTKVDLCDSGATRAFVKALAPSHCLNLAWYAKHGKFWRAPENLAWVQASINLLRAFADAGGRRFVGAGSCAEYDWSQPFLSEATTPRTPHTPFGRCKNALFEATMAYADMTGISAAWGRVFFVYGPGEVETRLVPHVISSLLAGRPAKTSAGEQIRDFSHVDDIAGGFAALLASAVQNGVNLASGQPVAVKTVIETIGRLIDRSNLIELGAIPSQPDEPSELVADIRRLTDEVGFRQCWRLERGLEATIQSYRS